MDTHLEWDEEQFQQFLRNLESDVDQQVGTITQHLKNLDTMPDEVIKNILDKTKELQQKVGYNGDYPEWKKEKLPLRLEDMPGRLDKLTVL